MEACFKKIRFQNCVHLCVQEPIDLVSVDFASLNKGDFVLDTVDFASPKGVDTKNVVPPVKIADKVFFVKITAFISPSVSPDRGHVR